MNEPVLIYPLLAGTFPQTIVGYVVARFYMSGGGVMGPALPVIRGCSFGRISLSLEGTLGPFRFRVVGLRSRQSAPGGADGPRRGV